MHTGIYVYIYIYVSMWAEKDYTWPHPGCRGILGMICLCCFFACSWAVGLRSVKT